MSKMKGPMVLKYMTVELFMVACIASLGSMGSGYDTAWWSSIMGNQRALKYYGYYVPTKKAYALESKYKSAGSGLGSAGIMLGGVACTPIAERYGRRAGCLFSALVCISGIIIELAAHRNFWGLTIGRLINGFGVGAANSIVPVYLSECAPAEIRGTLLSFYQWFYTFGSFFAYLFYYVSRGISNDWSFLTVIILQLPIPLFMLFSLYFLIESPRWLALKGRRDAAVTSLQKLNKNNITEEQANNIVDDLISQYKGMSLIRANASYMECFNKKNFYRTQLALSVPCFLNGQGLAFMGNYLVLFLMQVGIKDTNMIMVVIMAVLQVTNSWAFYGTDKFGRRPTLLVGAAAMGISFYIVGTVSYYGNGGPTANNTVVGFLFIWSIFYGATWAPLQHVVCGELPTAKLREKTMTLVSFFSFGIALMMNFVIPYIMDTGYGALGGRLGLVYASISVFAIFYIFFLMPETKGLTLEVIDHLFDEKFSALKFHDEGKRRMADLEDTIIDEASYSNGEIDKSTAMVVRVTSF